MTHVEASKHIFENKFENNEYMVKQMLPLLKENEKKNNIP